MLKPKPLPVLALLAASPLALADTITVGPEGSGADFADIGPAIDAALAGDTVLVAAGNYVDVGTLTIDKPLTVLGAGSDVTTFRSVAAAPFEVPLPLLVSGLAAGEEVRVVGLTLESNALGGITPTTAFITDCDGAVVLADLTASGTPTTFSSGAMVGVDDSSRVTLDGCDFTVLTQTQVTPAVALSVSNSSVSVNDCFLQSGSGAILFGSKVPFDGRPGIVAENALLRIANTTIRGGNGTSGTPFGTPQVVTQGAPAVLASSSTLFVRGGGTSLIGGKGGNAFFLEEAQFGSGGAAIEFSPDSLATATPNVVLQPGLDGDNQLTVAPVEGGGVYVALPEPLATLSNTTPVVDRGATATFDQSGANGSTYFTWLAFDQGPELALPGFLGTLVLPIGQSTLLPTATLDGAGQGQLDVPVPNAAVLEGATLLFQGLALAPSGELSFSSGVFLGVL